MSFTAKYRGVCVTCDDEILKGQDIRYPFGNAAASEGEVEHVNCPSAVTARTRVDGALCPVHFITLPVTGVCGECE